MRRIASPKTCRTLLSLPFILSAGSGLSLDEISPEKAVCLNEAVDALVDYLDQGVTSKEQWHVGRSTKDIPISIENLDRSIRFRLSTVYLVRQNPREEVVVFLGRSQDGPSGIHARAEVDKVTGGCKIQPVQEGKPD